MLALAILVFSYAAAIVGLIGLAVVVYGRTI